ncbi:SPFH domain-containing protein [Lentisphaerota bacterium WC36G]|nr:SPFH domain-containing protein [Lentisphaerae bacterium WC36]
MGWFTEKLRNEFIDIIEWEHQDSSTLVHRFPRYQNEIKMGAKLIVRPGQKAVFVNEGQIADVFEPGTYELETQNMPILATLKGWKYGFNSPFKAEVYFISTVEILDCKWGTATPVIMRDSDFGMVRLRARGNYSYRINISQEMISKFVGSRDEFSCEDLEGQLRARLISSFSDCVGELKIPALELAANYDEMGEAMVAKLTPDFTRWGIELQSFAVENISLPEEVQKAMDERASMGAIGNLNQFSQYQAAQALRDAANNEGSLGGMMGMMMGQQMPSAIGGALVQDEAQAQTQTHNQNQMAQSNVAPPPIPSANQVQIFVAVNGQQTGPFDFAAISQMIQQGTLTKETLVWKEGMASWDAAANVAELSSVFGQVPPPVPGI